MRTAILAVSFLSIAAYGQEHIVRSAVTYVAAGNVYASSGRNHGVTDSSSATVIRGGERIALRFVAASSRSSSWTADSALDRIAVGDSILIAVPVVMPVSAAVDTGRSSRPATTPRPARRPPTAPPSSPGARAPSPAKAAADTTRRHHAGLDRSGDVGDATRSGAPG